jgi:hypothetical protein
MIRTRFAKPALAVLGFTTLLVLYVSIQRSHRNVYPLTRVAFQQFDQSAENAAASQPDSPEAANPSMPQSEDGTFIGQAGQADPGQAGQGTHSHANDSFIADDDTMSIRGQSQPNRQAGPYGQSGQYGEAGQYAPTSYGSGPASAGGWAQQAAPDGSSTLALPANWRVAGGAKGSVAVVGPSSEQLILGLQTFVTSNQAPYMPPEQALAWFMRKNGAQLLGIEQHEVQQANSGQAELIVGESELQGQKYKIVARVTTSQIGMGNWMLQISSMGAPVERFDADFPTMQKIWNSWKLNNGYVQGGFQTAANIRSQTAQMATDHAMSTVHRWDDSNADWDQTIRGVTTMENSTLGKRVETRIGTEQQYLNNCARNGQDCRQVPQNELVPQQ